MTGAIELAEEVLRMPVRLGLPSRVVGLNETIADPVFATAVGLLLYLEQQQKESLHPASSLEQSRPGLFSKMKRWVAQF